MGSTHQSNNEKDQPKHSSSHKDNAGPADPKENAKGPAKAEEATAKTAPEPKREPKNVTITDVELDQLKNEVSEYKDKYLRVLAESENARKRLQKEKQEMIQYALQNVIVDFLNPIDHMENALKFTQQMSEEVKHWAIGFQMILGQFKDVLTNNGVTAFVSEGKPFDPHFHEAVEVITSTDVAPNIVIEESLKGYKMGDRIIRPARVKVTKAPAEPAKEIKNHENQTIEKPKK